MDCIGRGVAKESDTTEQLSLTHSTFFRGENWNFIDGINNFSEFQIPWEFSKKYWVFWQGEWNKNPLP